MIENTLSKSVRPTASFVKNVIRLRRWQWIWRARLMANGEEVMDHLRRDLRLAGVRYPEWVALLGINAAIEGRVRP